MLRFISSPKSFLRAGSHVAGLVIALSVICNPNDAHAQSASFTLHADQPALGRSNAGNWDSAYLDPGVVLFHEGTYHMFYVAIPQWPHPLAIGYATSANGLDWERQSDSPVLSAEQTGALGAKSIMSTSALVTDTGEWILYFTTASEGENFYGHVGRATAPNPLGPWTVDSDPVLSPGPEGAWDGLSVGDASVVRTQTGFAMYYAGFGDFKNGAFAEKRANIGMATSQDGVHWTKHDDPSTTDPHFKTSDPILSVSPKEAGWDTFRVVDPNVQQTPDGWLMSYRGASFDMPPAVGLAMSTDGITWEHVSDDPVFQNREAGKTIVFTSLLSRPEQDFLYLEMGSTSSTEAYVATRNRAAN